MTAQQAGVSAEAVAKLDKEQVRLAYKATDEEQPIDFWACFTDRLNALATVPPEQGACDSCGATVKDGVLWHADHCKKAASDGALSADWWEQEALDVIRSANTYGLPPTKARWVSCITTGLLRAFNRGQEKLAAHDQKVREPLAAWMIQNSFATGHGDTVEDLLKELKWQIEERDQKVRAETLEEAVLAFKGAYSDHSDPLIGVMFGLKAILSLVGAEEKEK